MRGRPAGLLSCALSNALCLALAAGVASAQERNAGGSRARKIDEFGRLHGCDGGARLDNFAVELENVSGSKGYIVARDARGTLRGAAHAWGVLFQQYFRDLRGMDESRFVVVDGASVSGDDLKMELWLVPDGAEPPHVKPPAKDDTRPFGGKYTELSVFSDTTFYDTDGAEAGAFDDSILYSSYRDLLKKQPDSQGYLVVYSPPGAGPGYWRRAGTRAQLKVAGADLSPERLTVISGGPLPAAEKKEKAADGEEGEENYGSVEFWVGAKGSPPVKHVEEDAALTQALFVGGNSFFSEEEGAWLLKNLAETMRGDEHSVGCIIVYPGDGLDIGTGEGGAEQPAPDAFKVAQGWKAELLKKHGFEQQRLVLLSGPQERWGAGRLEVWVVSHGAPLPDPFAELEREEAEEEGDGKGDGGEEVQPPPPVRQEE